MKRFFIITLVFLAILAIIGFVFRNAAGFWLMSFMLTPSSDWSEDAAPPAPDYSLDSGWAALPSRADNADFVAGNETDEQANARVDLFFLYPTTYYNSANWNAPLDDEGANKIMEQGVMRGQASAFNACCRIHAPRYRQATLASFLDRDSEGKAGNGDRALELAYADVLLAFRQFLTNIGTEAPFVLAGHSQGSAHLKRLIQEEVSGTPLMDRLIAAYPIGYRWNQSELAKTPDVLVCGYATQTACVVTWNAVGPKAQAFEDVSQQICVNPLNWLANDTDAPHESNLGSLYLGGIESTAPPRLLPAVADARCTGGRLLVSELRSDDFRNQPISLGEDNYHVLDYALYYINLRRNAVDRVNAYFANQQAVPLVDDELAPIPSAPMPPPPTLAP